MCNAADSQSLQNMCTSKAGKHGLFIYRNYCQLVFAVFPAKVAKVEQLLREVFMCVKHSLAWKLDFFFKNKKTVVCPGSLFRFLSLC